LGDVTQLLRHARDGDRAALDQALSLVYNQLQMLARRQLRRERAGHTLDTGALVHEAYVKLVESAGADWQDRGHFLGIAARAMRQILVDHARRKQARKRGGAWQRTTLAEERLGASTPVEEMLALDHALDRLGELDQRMRQVVECRFFAGLSEQETAVALGVTDRTVRRDWVRARAWLYKLLYPDAARDKEV
jgi:RNA polymerase sigma factor (TIGR02999 family)